MATYLELRDLWSNDTMRNKLDTAVVQAANDILELATPTNNQLAWASAVLNGTRFEADKAYKSILAQNNTASVATITAATDATIQTNVDSVVDNLVAAFNA